MTEKLRQRRFIKMKKGLIVLIAIVGIIAIFVIGGIGTYNGLVQKDEAVTEAWSQVENQLQRRFDLIPNLVETVKGYATHEEETLTAVVEARNKFASAGTVAEMAEADSQLVAAMRQLSVVVEAYPELKANQSFQDLMTQLEGTENRIAVARMDYNTVVGELNARIRRFPTVIIANMAGIDKRDYFEAVDGVETAPAVDFSKE